MPFGDGPLCNARRLSALLVAGAAVFSSVGLDANGETAQVRAPQPRAFVSETGLIAVDFDDVVLDTMGWSVTTDGDFGKTTDARAANIPVLPESDLEFVIDDDGTPRAVAGSLRTRGAMLITGPGTRAVIGNLTVSADADGRWSVRSTLDAPDAPSEVFYLASVLIDFSRDERRLRLAGELALSPQWTTDIGRPDAADLPLGTFVADVHLAAAKGDRSSPGPHLGTGEQDDAGTDPEPRAGVIGPDVIVGDLYQTSSYGEFSVDDISAFAVGTVSCNVGDERLDWYANTPAHPVISQSLYRWKNQGFEQIGISWVKHGFYAVSGTLCGPCDDVTGGNQLGIGCSDPYSASLNGVQENLSPRSQVNPHTGVFPYPWSAPDPLPTIGRRLQVHNNDLNSTLNFGAVYFVEGHYVTQDDAAAGNQNNNASYRRAYITNEDGIYYINLLGQTVRRQPAIRAWKDNDPDVVETDIQDPNDGLYILSAKAIYGGNGFWHYDYALFNLNANRGARSLSIPIDPGALVANVGFHDVDHHSGEPYSGFSWTWEVVNNEIKWSTDTHAANPNANALRWGTLYSFRFDSNVQPAEVLATVELFAPGTPGFLKGSTIGPRITGVCGDGQLEGLEECDPPDGSTCHTDCKLISGDPLRGGLLWDKWWVVTGAEPPTGVHPLYPPGGVQSGSTTYRCKECHGWDYKGVDGAYSSGPHYTGIPGVFASTRTHSAMFDLLTSAGGPDGHDFDSLGMDQSDVWDVVHFMQDLLIDTEDYIDTGGAFIGNAPQGQANYTAAGSVACVVCHGADGTAINFGTPQDPQWVGTVATDNPWELLHKIRMGAPGTSMPGWTADGGSDQGAADIGRYAQLNFPSNCLDDGHCDDGLYCNGLESCDLGTCLAGIDPCPDEPCDELSDACGAANALRGGLLWDEWWEVLGELAPPEEHPLYPLIGQQTGTTTYRCKECHGWDYKGVDGAYGSGPHFTGIKGVFNTAMAPADIVDLISLDDVPNGHGFRNYGLEEQDAWDLAQFITDLAIDTDLYVDAAGQFNGDPVEGQFNYQNGGFVACTACHGSNGTAINFGTAQQPEWIGTIAVYNPWELLHKIRFGQPASPMGSWLAAGETDQGAADIGAYAQVDFPVDCMNDGHCSDGEFCTGEESCVGRFCEPGTDPCPGGVCDEAIDTCLSGLCAAPIVEGVGARYLAITPQPVSSDTPQAFLVTPDCSGSTPKYIGYLKCDGTGPRCNTDADCNSCSFSGEPCLADPDCPVGFCDSGQECWVTLQNCVDQSECVGVDFCEVSGQSCIPGDPVPIDINNDGMFDGVVAELVDDPASAVFMTPNEWGASLMRCSKTGTMCASPADCDRGICDNGSFCAVSLQNCGDLSVCVLNENCVAGRIYVTGDGIAASDLVADTDVLSTYIVRANCGTLAAPDMSLGAAASTWRWADTDHNGFVNVSDVQLILLAIQGSYNFSAVVADDLAGIGACAPQQILNVSDVQMAIRALQGEHFRDVGCDVPCP